jgi:anti-sigma B factor antagonist
MAFSYNIEKNDGLVILSMIGRLVDKVEAVEISTEVEEELKSGNNRFIIDLSEMEYMNSTGLNIIINLMNKSKNNGGEAVVASAPARILSLFTVTKLNSVFTIKDSREEAIAYFKQTVR